MIARYLVCALMLLPFGPAGTQLLQARQKPAASHTVKPGGTGKRLRALRYLAGGAGLFVGGAMLFNHADQYQKGKPVCIYFGCLPSTIHTRNRGMQVGGATMMGSGATLFVLGLRDWDR